MQKMSCDWGSKYYAPIKLGGGQREKIRKLFNFEDNFVKRKEKWNFNIAGRLPETSRDTHLWPSMN